MMSTFVHHKQTQNCQDVDHSESLCVLCPLFSSRLGIWLYSRLENRARFLPCDGYLYLFSERFGQQKTDYGINYHPKM